MKTSELKNLVKECVKVIVSETKEKGDKKWIQKAVKKSHKGYCTPMTKKTCTPRRKALAMRFKKGDIHKDNVGESQGGTSVPHDYSGDNETMRHMEESAPPGFGKGKIHGHIYDKLLKQYKNDPSKAYATMWSIHDKMEEAVNTAMNECGMMDEAGLTSEHAEDGDPENPAPEETGMEDGEEMTVESVLKQILTILDDVETLEPEKASKVLSIVKKIIEVLVKPEDEEPQMEPGSEDPDDGEKQPNVEPDAEPPQKV